MRALRAHARVEEPEEAGLRWAAVALVLRGHSVSDAELLFIRRAERAGDPWSGHVAFPGGRREPADRSLEETARRETREELALDLDLTGTMLGVLDDLRPRSPVLPSIAVRPYVFHVTVPVPLVPNVEVHSAFWQKVRSLRDPAVQWEHAFDRGGARMRFPAYRCGDDIVWGMTERILTQFLSVALP
ncbi:MAG: CoA pyrophosphatase [Gemmatimonadaceae bacterium]|nr:CoA pyrophosphatase [Gemmatimonadaceae bacterium]